MGKFGCNVLAWCLAFWIAAQASVAQDVRLTSRDGEFTLEGTLLAYDGEFFRVDTVYGTLTIDGQGVICDGPGCPDLENFVVEVALSGSRLMADVLVPALIYAFAERQGFKVIREVQDDSFSVFIFQRDGKDRARFTLRGSTTGEGFADLIANEADIGLVIRPPSSEERRLARVSAPDDPFRGRRSRVIGLDGIVLTSPLSQDISELSLSEIQSVFSGELGNWLELGGVDLPIQLYAPNEGSGLTETFRSRILGRAEMGAVSTRTDFESLADLSDAVVSDPAALGLSTLSERGNGKVMNLRGGCGFSIQATAANLRTEDYPLTLPLMYFTPARRIPLLARDFISFSASDSASPFIRRAGFVDQTITATPIREQGNRLAHAIQSAGEEVSLTDLKNLVQRLQGFERLSTTFRFAGGTTELDAQSTESIARLVQQIELGTFDGRTLLLVGFSDGEGPAPLNQRLSQKRAETVLAELKDALSSSETSRLKMQSVGFGEALPMACDDEPWGRAVNRRVEVWLR